MYPERESNPHDQWSKVFKTLASTYFAIWASKLKTITVIRRIIAHIIAIVRPILISLSFQSVIIPKYTANADTIAVAIKAFKNISITLIVFKVNKKVAVSFHR